MPQILNTLLVDQAYEAIKEDVLHKTLIPGAKVNPREISERYDISVTPIKQALNRLVSEGLIECLPHRGMIVKNLSEKEILDSIEARRMIELYSAPYVIKQAKENPKFIVSLERNLNDYRISIEESSKTNNYLKQNNLDFEFHKILVDSTNNERIEGLYENLRVHLILFYLYGNNDKTRFQSCLNEHETILSAIKSLDEKALTDSISKHLENVLSDYRSSLNNKSY